MSVLVEPRLPRPRGPVSAALLETLAKPSMRAAFREVGAPLAGAEPYGADLQLALYACYELHYRGFDGVDPRWEWDVGVLHLRSRLEDLYLGALHADIGPIGADETAADEMAELSVEPPDGSGPSYHLRGGGTWEQMREYFVHRSIYHLKEGDPHAFAIPRLSGQAKASFVAVEFDEYGAGKGAHLHQQLFADLMDAAGLDSAYLGYIDHVPAESLAVVNLMSMFGLHRRWRGAAVGHFAATEITSSPGSHRLVRALERLGAPDPCTAFYREHVEADAVHEQVVRTDVVGDLVAREPHIECDVVFGMRAFDLVESRLGRYLMSRWAAGRSSLLRPL